MPQVLPRTSRPTGGTVAGHAPERTKRSHSQMRRIDATINPIARSATASVIASGVLVTGMPRSRAGAMSNVPDCRRTSR